MSKSASKSKKGNLVEKRFQVTSSFIDHQYYHKWVMLTDPRDPVMGVKGYIKCNITVIAKGERVRVHPEIEEEDDITR